MKLRYLLIVVLLLVSGTSVVAQQWKRDRYEVIGGITVNQLFGDIGGSASTSTLMGLKDITFSAIRPGITVGLRYKAYPNVSVKGLLSSCYMVASDKGSRNESRALEASAFVTDFAVTGEYHILKASESQYYSIMSVRGGVRPYGGCSVGVYAYAGVGGAFFSTGGNTTLKENPRYIGGSGFTAIVPIGLGVRVNLMPRITFNGELGARYTLTDKLDGYTSPYSKSNDIYYTLSLGVSYKLIAKKRFGRN